jgi:acetyltransferase-like isoleucine patch superfamily enzyme/glycosyltransferase involved in cell wall biosynthesis
MRNGRIENSGAATWPEPGSVPVSVLVPVKNEEANLAACLDSVRFAAEVVVIDSQSTDRTIELAEADGARVVQFHYDASGWPKKKNWALANVDWAHEWVLILDADERITPPLAREIEDVVRGRYAAKHGQPQYDGYYLNRRFVFMGRWIKHCGYYPSYNLRLFKHELGRYERIGELGDTGSGDNEVHEHVVLRDGRPAGTLEHDFNHFAYPNLEVWIEKHNRYSNWEAHAMLAGVRGELHASLMKSSTQRRRWIKHRVRYLPFRPTLRFLYCYVLQLGVLDGYPGYVLSRLMAWYELVSLAKYREMCHALDTPGGNGVPTMPADTRHQDPNRTPPPSPIDPPQAASGEATGRVAPTAAPAAGGGQTQRAVQHQPQRSPWSLRAKLGRVLWMVVGRPLFRTSFHNWYGFRARLLRVFGAEVGKRTAIRPSVRIEIPWMLRVEDEASVGDYAILYCLGPTRIGARSIISQYAHLCAGTHDYTQQAFPLIRSPITVGTDVWIGADAFIGPGVTVGDRAVIGARASLYHDAEPDKVYVGNPARAIKDRELRE